MVAIVSGNSLGLNLTSSGVLGGQGVWGDPKMGQGGEQVYVNAATGNLVMQQLQDHLVGSGLDVNSVLTYNSLGLANDDNGDNFSIGRVPGQMVLSSGTLNAAGSTLTRTAFDGSQAVFTWDATSSRYVAVNGAGAFDTVTYASSRYTWVDGATQVKETYDGATGNLLTRTDPAGNTLTFGYTGSLLTSVTDANGETVTYVYSGSLLQQIKAPVTTWINGTATTSLQPVVTYTYDGSNRLASVIVDLSPDGSIADGKVYTTSYTYDGASKRVKTVTQSDGTAVTFVYDGSNRVYTITDALGNVTTYTYDTGNRRTSVLANGQTTVYAYDAGGKLLSVTAPAVNGVTTVTRYAYNANGEVVSIIDGDGRTTTMAYDAAGNQVSVLDGDGELTTRVYDAQNRLITETTALAPTPALLVTAGMSVSGGNVVKTAATNNWDAAVRSGNGITGAATVAFTPTSTTTHLMVGLNADPDTDANYTSLDYAVYLESNNLAVFVNNSRVADSIGTYAAGDRLAVVYDGNGHVNFLKNGQLLYTLAAAPSQPLYVDTSFYEQGSSVANLTFSPGANAAPGATSRYVYSADGKGLLRYKISPDGRVTEYGYNAQGQLTATNAYVAATYDTSALAASAAPSEATMNAWRASQNLGATERTDIQRDSRQQISSMTAFAQTNADGTGVIATGAKTTFVYDPAGRLLQTIKPGASSVTYAYDGAGRVTLTKDALGRATTTAYSDAAGTVAVTYANQLVTTTTLDKGGRVTSSMNSYAGVVVTRAGVDYDSLGNVLRKTDLTGASTWFLYDAMSRKVAAIDGTGALTEYVYDAASQVTETIAYATQVNPASLVDGNGKPSNPSLASVRPAFNAATDQRSWVVYDAAGHISQTISATGAVTQFAYDGAGRTTAVTTFAAAVNVSSFGAAPGFQFAASSAGDRISRTFYDRDGNVAGSLDPAGYLTVYQYDGAGQKTVTLRYATLSPVATAQSTLAQLIPAVSPSDRRSVTLYGANGLVAGEIDPLGYLTQYVYNPRNTLDHTTRYATPVGNAIAAGSSVDAVKPAGTAADSTTTYTYDAGDRVTVKTDPAGIVTTYSYDGNTDELLGTTVGSGRTDATTTQTRYDASGRPIAVLDGVGNALITNGMSQAQIDAIWLAHSSSVVYDLGGRKASSRDALGNVTLYFYDGDGQLRYTVDPLNSVKELRYDAFGHVTTTIAYGTVINPAGIGAGGLVTAALSTAVSSVANAATDQVTRAAYDVNGRQVFAIDATGGVARSVYDSMGNLVSRTQYATPISLPTIGSADGKTVTVAGDYGSVTANYAAIDTSHTYTVTARVRQVSGSGSVYVGVVTRDANGNEITNAGNGGTYVYCSACNVTLTPEMGWQTFTGTISGTQVTTAGGTSVLNKFFAGSAQATPLVLYNYYGSNGDPGRDVEIDSLILTDNTTGAVLSLDSQLANGSSGLRIAGALDEAASSSTAALSVEQIGARLRLSALDRTTRYAYDADGRQIFEVDAAGAVTQTTYDATGSVTARTAYATPIVLPASGSADGKTVTVAGNYGSVTANYAAIDTSHTYTVAARVRQLSGSGSIYVGVVTRDTNGNEITNAGNGGTYVYCSACNVALTPEMGWQTFTGTISGTQVTTANGTSVLNKFFAGSAQATPLILYNYYGSNGDPGRDLEIDSLVLTDSTTGAVLNIDPQLATGAGVIKVVGAVDEVADARTAALSADQIRSRLRPSAGMDRTTRYAYDADGRQIFAVDPAGAVTQTAYDSRGYVVAQTQYAVPIALPAASSADGKTVTVSGDYGSVTSNYAAIDISHNYTVSARVRQVSGAGSIYVGVVTRDANGNEITNAGNGGTYVYCSASNVALTPEMGWQTFSGTISGTQVTSAGGTSVLNKFFAGSAQATPLILYNYYGSNADPGRDLEIDSLVLTDNTTGAVLNVDPSMATGAGALRVVGNVDGSASSTTVTLGADQIRSRLRPNATDRTARYAYDADGRQIFAVDAAGSVTQTTYDAAGNVIAQTRYGTPIGLPAAGSADGKTVTVAGDYGAVTTNYAAIDTSHTYTVTARVRQVSGSGSIYVGVVTRDAGGNEITNAGNGGTYVYCAASGAALAPEMGWQTFSGTISGTQVTTAGGTSVLNKFFAGSAQATPLILYNYYGSNGDPARDFEIDSLVLTDNTSGTVLSIDPQLATGTGALKVVGNVDEVASSPAVALSADQIRSRLRPSTVADRTVRYAYDGNGRRIFAVDATGAVAQTTYDATGNVVETIQYATQISLPASGSVDGKTVTVSGDYGAVTANYSAIDTSHTYTVSARVRQISGSGSIYVGVVTKDASGNEITNAGNGGTYVYCAASGVALTPEMGWQMFSGTISGTQVTTAGGTSVLNKFFAGSAQATPLILYNYYGSNGDPGRDFEIDSLVLTDNTTGAVLNIDSQLTTGAAPIRVVGSVDSVAASPIATLTADQIRTRLRPSPSSDRTSRFAYDADGRQIFTVDAAGGVAQTSYDALGNVVNTRRYSTPISLLAAGSTDFKTVTVTGDYAGLTAANYAAIDTSHTYTVTARVRQVSGAGSIYVGVITKDANGNEITNAGNGGTYVYCAACNVSLTPDLGWQTFSGTISGTQITTAGGSSVLNKFFAGSAQATPLILYNYYGGNGDPGRDLEIDSLVLTDTTTGAVLNIDPSLATGAAGLKMISGAVDSIASSATAPLTADQIRSRLRLNAAADQSTSNEYDANGRLVWSADALGHATRVVYDAFGRPAWTIAADGAVSRTDYDADGRVACTTKFANKLPPGTFAGLAHAPSSFQMAAITMSLAASGKDATVASRYDAFGRLTFTMDGNGAIQETRYDAQGNVVDSFAYANPLDPSAWSTLAAPVPVVDPLHDRHVHASYDVFGDVLAKADGTGAVVINAYDEGGRLVERVSYANRIAANAWTSGTAPGVTSDVARDIRERYVYDGLGRLAWSSDGNGAVTAYGYDANDRLTQKTQLANLATVGQALNAVTRNPATDRTERFAYDAFGQATWHADGAGSLDFTGHDGVGRVVRTIQYAQPIVGDLPTSSSPMAVGPLDRAARAVFDGLGNVTYTVDALNRVSLSKYDAAGRLSSTTRYASTILAGGEPGSVIASVAVDETTSFAYDDADHLTQRTDALQGVQSYTYDGLGNKLSFTNEKLATWTYAYDPNGRLLNESTPVVDIKVPAPSVGSLAPAIATSSAAIVTAMTYDGVGNLLTRTEASGTSDARTMRYDYDAAGRQTKVTSQAFNVYNESLAAMGTDSLVGSAARQEAPSAISTVSTTLYDAFGNAVANVGMMTQGQFATPVSYKAYDQANRLVFELDASGYLTAYTRDAFGGGIRVTRYAQGISLGLGVPTSSSAAPAPAALVAAVAGMLPSGRVGDRQIDYVYDKAGRIVQTSEPTGIYNDASSSTTNQLEIGVRHVVVKTYDAFGDVVLVHDLQNAAQQSYADAYSYFDAGGRNTATIDARGFATTRVFDAFDNLKTQVEYAIAKSDGWSVASFGANPGTATTQSGPDRTATYTYDQLNRKTSETHTLAFVTAADTFSALGYTQTSYGYDALGNVTRTTNESGSTYMEYDVLGRLRATILPAQVNALDSSTLTPVTEYWYDEFGQRTIQIQRANTATGVSEFKGNWAAGSTGYTVVAAAATPFGGDRTTTTSYDKAGHVVEVDGPLASTANTQGRTYSSYDAMGRVAKTWHTVIDPSGTSRTAYVGYIYDALGRVRVSYAPSSGSSAQHAVDTSYAFNAFGELAAKAVEGATVETYDYDNNGNVWRSNANDGVVRVYMYDMAGRQTSVILSNGVSTSDHYLGSYASAAWAQAYSDISGNDPIYRRTDTVFDKMGNAVATITPQRENSANGFSLIAGSTNLTMMPTQNAGVWQAAITVTVPDLSALGSGDLMLVATTKSKGGTYTGTAYFSGVAGASLRPTVVVKTYAAAADTGPSVEVWKKDVNGVFQLIIPAGPTGTTFNIAAVAAPTGATNVQFTYKSTAMGSSVTGTPVNFGNLWAMNLGATTGTVTYTSTFAYADGTSTTTQPATFNIGSSTTTSAAVSFIRATTLQAFDRWGNVLSRSDPRNANWLTKYSYNANNQVTRQVQAVNAADISQWSGLDNSGAAVTSAPTTTIYYDAQGHQVEVIDPNGHKTVQKFDAAGNVIELDQGYGSADKTRSISLFDAFGNQVQSIAARGFDVNGNLVTNALAGANASDLTTLYFYDQANDLTKTQHGTTSGGSAVVWGTSGTTTLFYEAYVSRVNIVESSTYDGDGHKISSTDGAGFTTTYAFDVNGNLLTTTLPLLAGQSAANAAKTTNDYDDFGHKTRTTDANGGVETWNYDYFGKRLLGTSGHSDLAGNVYTYTYDNAGEIVLQASKTSGGAQLQNEAYTYDKAGQLLQLSQYVTAGGATRRLTQYTYDLSGQHLRETTSQGPTGAMAVYQDNHLAYDALGRLVDSSDESVHVSFGYDAVGNRIHTSTHVILDQALTTGGAANGVDTDNWNTFDALNRQIHVNYKATYDSSHRVTALNTTSTSHTLAYDADSNRIADSHVGNTVVVDRHVIQSGEDVGILYKVGQAGVTVTDNYQFDALDRLDSTWRLDSSNKMQVIDQRKYDADGRTVVQGPGSTISDGDTDYQGSFYRSLNSGITDPSLQIGYLYTVNAYDSHGQVTYSRSANSSDPTSSVRFSLTDYSSQTTSGAQTRGYDAAGNLMGQSTTNYSWTNSVVNSQSVSNTLTKLESYQVLTTKTTVSSTSDTATTAYDLDGYISGFTDPGQTTFNRTYVADTSGQVLSTTETAQVLRNLVVAGHVVGQYGTGLDAAKPQNTNQTANLTERTSFGFGFKQISGAAAGNGAYVVNGGDTLQSIAYAAYGDSSQWWRVAQANGLSSDHDLKVGQSLRMPAVAGGTRNSSSTFEPYDPSKIIGDTSAHLPTPAGGKSGCGGVGMIVMIVVAVVATIFTAGAAALAMAGTLGATLGSAGAIGAVMSAGGAALAGATASVAGLAAAAIGGAVGSIVSQGVGMAIGAQKGFSWKQVGISAVGSMVGAGIGQAGVGAAVTNATSSVLGAGSVYAAAMASAALGSVVSQGVDQVVGLQKNFSWKQVAASTASAGASAAAGAATDNALNGVVANEALRKVIDGTVGGIAGGVSASVVRGGKVDMTSIAVDAFGNALGQAAVAALTPTSAELIAQRTGKKLEQVTALLKEIETRRAALPDADKNNLLMLALGQDIPADTLRAMWDNYKSDKIKFNVGFAPMKEFGSYTPGENGGTINLNEDLYAGMLKGGDRGQMAGALLQSALWEEQGHAMDEMARQAAGTKLKDSPHDEGAIFSVLMANDVLGSLPQGTSAFTFKNQLADGSVLQLSTSTAYLKATANETVYSGRILDENRDEATGKEYFGPEGHYMSTGLIARGVADALCKTPEEAQLVAGRLALWAQVPDMLDDIDAKSQYISAFFGGGLGFSASEKLAMEQTFSAVHALAPAGENPGEQWILDQRTDARHAILSGLAEGDFAGAGFAIHKLGDTYAHTDEFGRPFVIPHGHGEASALAMIGIGRDPDDIYGRPALTRAYVKDLSYTLATGLGALDDNVDVVSASGYGKWADVYGANTDQRGFGKSAADILSSSRGLGDAYVGNYSVGARLPAGLSINLTMNQDPLLALMRVQARTGFQPSGVVMSNQNINWNAGW